MSTYRLILCLMWTGLNLLLSSESASAREIGDVTSAMLPGKGYDSATGKVGGECVKWKTKQSHGGWETLYYLRHVESSEALASEMNMSVSASVKPIFGAGGSMKVQYFSGRKFNSFTSYLLVKSVIKAPPEQIVEVDLKADYLKLWNSNPEAFRRACGDEFLIGTISGGEFYAIIEFSTKTEDDKSSLDAEIEASVGIYSGSAKLSTSLSKLTSNRTVTAQAFAAGPRPVIFNADVDNVLMKQVGGFANEFKDAQGNFQPKGVVYAYLSQGFDTLPAIAANSARLSPQAQRNQKQMLDRLTHLIFDRPANWRCVLHRDSFETIL